MKFLHSILLLWLGELTTADRRFDQQPQLRSLKGAGPGSPGNQFCKSPGNNNGQGSDNLNICGIRDRTWSNITAGKDIILTQNEFSNECGPHCRPSCVTLMLDLTVFLETDLICEADKLCQCETSKCNHECTAQQLGTLWDEYPKCYLERTDCLGPTIYDDYISYATQGCEVEIPQLKHCTAIPDDDLYCRFKDFPIITPLESFSSCNGECFDDGRVYFEYCNIVEEEQNCDDCDNGKCGKDCKKTVEPFPPGWTTFVVSASIPYTANRNQKCDSVLQYEQETDTACFLQRVEIYYPPKDENCDTEKDCPVCHDCPLLSIGDHFGPLEVVGFGNCINQQCAACDSQASKDCGACKSNCNALFNCDASVDCSTGASLGIPDFSESCSFCA